MSEDWRPSASLRVLRERARILRDIRAFFDARGVIEIDAPVLASATVTDVHIDSLRLPDHGRELFLQTSPEYFLKRYLAAGGGDCYCLGKAFRAGERGGRHNPEFTLLEWYRIGLDDVALAQEVATLIHGFIAPRPVQRRAYQAVFEAHLGIDPLTASATQLRDRARVGGDAPDMGDDRQAWLDLLFSLYVQPRLGRGETTIVHGFPAEQAALARLDQADPRLARRFECFVDGLELANGYFELTDPDEQAERFARDRRQRAGQGRDAPRLDDRLMAALQAGLPDCSGVALGVDRLVMLALGVETVGEVLPFSWDRV